MCGISHESVTSPFRTPFRVSDFARSLHALARCGMTKRWLKPDGLVGEQRNRRAGVDPAFLAFLVSWAYPGLSRSPAARSHIAVNGTKKTEPRYHPEQKRNFRRFPILNGSSAERNTGKCNQP